MMHYKLRALVVDGFFFLILKETLLLTKVILDNNGSAQRERKVGWLIQAQLYKAEGGREGWRRGGRAERERKK